MKHRIQGVFAALLLEGCGVHIEKQAIDKGLAACATNGGLVKITTITTLTQSEFECGNGGVFSFPNYG